MTRRASAAIAPAAAGLALAAALAAPVRAQYGPLAGGLTLPWAGAAARVTRISAAPREALPSGGNRVLVYLTADPDGRMAADAVWQEETAPLENRGPARLDGLAIELLDRPAAPAGVTPPEALDAAYGVTVTTVIDNPRVLVVKHRYDPLAYAGPLHFHDADVLVVYLRGGYTWPPDGFWGPARVRRGDVGVIPANTPHRLANAGGDPLELLVIVPR